MGSGAYTLEQLMELAGLAVAQAGQQIKVLQSLIMTSI
jgi:hypothetical protein